MPIDLEKRLKTALARARIAGVSNVFALGCAPIGSLSILQQQEEALILAAAILLGTKLDPIAIVGGGVAGLTAAATLALAGREVEIFEEGPVLLSTLRNGFHRYIHPYIAQWPRGDWWRKEAPYPPLKWHDGPAPQVAAKILESFDEVRRAVGDRLRVHTSTRVVGREFKAGGGVPSELQFHELLGRSGFAAIIVAVGLGVDGVRRSRESHVQVRGDDTQPYWEPDGLHSIEAAGGPSVCRILVSGRGDGGLTEVARATIAGYHHEQLIRVISGRAVFQSLGELMRRFEERREHTEIVRPIKPEEYFERDEALWHYSGQELSRLIRWNHTQVDWVAEGVKIRGTQMINRFVVLAILQARRARLIPGRVERVYHSGGARLVELSVSSSCDRKEHCEGPYAAVCLRLGPAKGRGCRPIDSVLPRRLRRTNDRLWSSRRPEPEVIAAVVEWLKTTTT